MPLSRVYTNPTILFALFMLFFSLNKTLSNDLSNIIRSDGSGYYAYLPALFIFNDPTFETSTKAEAHYLHQQSSPLYLIRAPNKKNQNKYFPGVAVLQAPFFLLSYLYSWLNGQTISGYSDTFSFFFYLGSLFYVFAGLFLFQRVLQTLFPNNQRTIDWLIPLFYIATPLFHYTINTPSFSHLYSFFLFAWFAWSILRLKNFTSLWRLLLSGFILGLIVIVRPTNALILLAIFYLEMGVRTLDPLVVRWRRISFFTP